MYIPDYSRLFCIDRLLSGGFTCDPGVYSCNKKLKEGNAHTLVVSTDNAGRKAITTVTTAVGINVHSVRVAFHSSDILGQIATPSATAGPSPTNSLSIPTSTATGAPPIQNAQTLPPGAWVGVGIGSTVGTILLFSGLVWLLWRYYSDRKRSAAVELPSGNDRQGWTPKFFSRTPVSELDPTPVMYELDDRAGQGRTGGGWQEG